MLLARGHAAAALRGLAATSTRHEALVDDAVNPPLVRALLDAFALSNARADRHARNGKQTTRPRD